MTTVAGRDVGALAERADALHRLHTGPRPLVLPNAWDAASARLVVKTGFPVVATSSGAIAATLGYEDNDSMPLDEAFGVVARITRSLPVPVTADLEAGYRLSPKTWSNDSWRREPSAATSKTPTTTAVPTSSTPARTPNASAPYVTPRPRRASTSS
jgi:Phosphoenolpyruvate phosphomutase